MRVKRVSAPLREADCAFLPGRLFRAAVIFATISTDKAGSRAAWGDPP